jgi:hypothetical protein
VIVLCWPGPRWMGERKGISKDRGTGPRFPPTVVSGSRPKPDPGRGSTVKQRKPTRVKPPKWRIGRLDPWLLATKKTMVFFSSKARAPPIAAHDNHQQGLLLSVSRTRRVQIVDIEVTTDLPFAYTYRTRRTDIWYIRLDLIIRTIYITNIMLC